MMIQNYLAPFVVAALISGGLTGYVKTLAAKLNLVDHPAPRKIHSKPVPRLGGVAIVLAFLIVLIGYALASPRLSFSPFKFWVVDKRLIGVLVGLIILLITGLIDDIKGVKAWKKLFWHIVAAAAVVAGGISISYLRLPFGSHINLTQIQFPIRLFDQTYHFVLWGDLLAVFWIVLLINTLNFLDGLDGLAAGVSVITGLVIFFLAISLGQDANALLAILIAGVAFGFLPWNFNPAKIFMGDSGSMALGFLLGVSSIISGGKLATAFLVLGIPVLDVGWVVLRRIIAGRSPFEADKGHFHHRLLTAGLSQRQAVIMLYLIASAFGVVAVIASTQEKIQAVISLVVLMLILAAILVYLGWRKKKRPAGENHG
ncbi:MAG: MraY family glycosyltransferase [Patescibacteria group bacterium]|jgi:UDP-GlcNAc:undecaprenyl-phosphate GlcNAc-1-phosphate transferase